LCGFERNYGGCIDMGAYETDVVSNINSKKKDSFAIYPNPATNAITVGSKEFEVNKVEILNFLGQTVLSQNENLKQDEIRIDISQFKPGNYILKITADNEVFAQKFVKK
jgi:hypothetical protein